MSKAERLRASVNHRLCVAAEEIVGLFEGVIAEYEEQLSRSKEENKRQQKLLEAILNPQLVLHKADAQQEEDPTEQQEWTSSLDQEEPQPPHIKEEDKELWGNQEGLTEVFNLNFPLTSVPVKTEDDEENAQSSQLHEIQTEEMKTRDDSEDCGGPEQVRNSEVENNLNQETVEKTEDSYEVELEISNDWGGLREHQSSFNSLEGCDSKRSNSDKTSHSSFRCNATFKTNQDLIQDIRIPNNKQPFSCSDCGKKFKHRSLMKKHMLVHTGEKPFSCSECDKRFNQKASLISHMMVHKGEKPFSCSECGKGFKQKGHLRRHVFSRKEEKPFSCPECDKRFSRKTCFVTHMKIHEEKKRFSCSKCDKRFFKKTHLNTHLLLHTGEKPFVCSVCNKRFNQKSNLTTHMARHSGVKPFSCSECEKRFCQKSDLRSHMLVHARKKPFSCPECDKGFSQRSYLDSHMVIHTGEKPFTCSICAQRFSCHLQLKTHECAGGQASEARHTKDSEEVCATQEPGSSFI